MLSIYIRGMALEKYGKNHYEFKTFPDTSCDLNGGLISPQAILLARGMKLNLGPLDSSSTS